MDVMALVPGLTPRVAERMRLFPELFEQRELQRPRPDVLRDRLVRFPELGRRSEDERGGPQRGDRER